MATLVRSDRRDHFDLAPEALWARMGAVDRYRDWWPWLVGFEAEGLRAGDVWTCVVQPPLPYRLRFTLTLVDVVPAEAVRATIDGDIVGTAGLDVRPHGSGSELRLVSALAPRHRALKAVSAVARPLAQYGHDWVLDTGLRQFRDRAR